MEYKNLLKKIFLTIKECKLLTTNTKSLCNGFYRKFINIAKPLTDLGNVPGKKGQN